MLLQHDNARPHMAKKTLQKMEELESIELLPNPTFSPDLEPSYYYLFCSMAQFLHGKKFQSVADVEAVVEEIFASKDKEWFYQAFKELAEKWVKTTEHEGLDREGIKYIICTIRNESQYSSVSIATGY
jgi:histone-lysine N-methyltransferase SETMAR